MANSLLPNTEAQVHKYTSGRLFSPYLDQENDLYNWVITWLDLHLCTRAWPQFWAAESWPYYKDVFNSVGLIDWMRYVLVLYACT